MLEQKSIVIFITAKNHDEAEKLANILVEQQLAACVQILPEITSIYYWKDKVQRDTEALILVKTIETHFAELEKTVKENHSYEVPEIVAVQASEVSLPYLNWVRGSVK